MSRERAQVGWLHSVQMVENASLIQAEQLSRVFVPHMTTVAGKVYLRIRTQENGDFVFNGHEVKLAIKSLISQIICYIKLKANLGKWQKNSGGQRTAAIAF